MNKGPANKWYGVPEFRLTPLERLRRSGMAPDRGLGQNFLIDPNILDVIERMASLGPDDIALEVGPGLGVLTERLLDRCGFVHSVEMDQRLAAGLEAEFGGRADFQLHMGDAVRFDLASLAPPPTKFVANLPYNVAAPLVMKSLAELPSLGLWCLMLQKEIADRFFAMPGSSNYGGISVMTQLATEKVSSRPVAPTVFFPRPRVQSNLLVFRRRPATEFPIAGFARIREIVYAAFSHRRKKLVNSLAEAGPELLPSGRGCGGSTQSAATTLAAGKRRLEELLSRLGFAGGVRPQELTPGQFARLVELMDETK